MKNKTVLITGANSGTGKWTSIELAKMGAHIVMLCRNKSRGENALKEIKLISGSNNIDLMICDLADIGSIIKFCDKFKAKYTKLDVLINNAGVILPKRELSKNGYELLFGVNHLGHFLLTNLLLDLLVKSEPSRIIVVSSGAHKIGRIHFNDINLENNWNMVKSYSQSKLANILFTYELSRRLVNTKVTVNALHPGTIKSNFAINRDTGFGKYIMKSLRPFFKTAKKASETAVYLASSMEVEGITGKYFVKSKISTSSSLSHEDEVAKKLWKISKEMTNEQKKIL